MSDSLVNYPWTHKLLRLAGFYIYKVLIHSILKASYFFEVSFGRNKIQSHSESPQSSVNSSLKNDAGPQRRCIQLHVPKYASLSFYKEPIIIKMIYIVHFNQQMPSNRNSNKLVRFNHWCQFTDTVKISHLRAVYRNGNKERRIRAMRYLHLRKANFVHEMTLGHKGIKLVFGEFARKSIRMECIQEQRHKPRGKQYKTWEKKTIGSKLEYRKILRQQLLKS